tara:strand:- start:56 stop:586 length:531 start_codon:yes stop_codon:yes gene_type:complete
MKVNQMFNTIIIDNFFDNFELLDIAFKKIPLFSLNEHTEVPEGISWPGKRSLSLLDNNTFLWQLTVKEIMNKSQNQRLVHDTWTMAANLHLRLKEDNEKDWIHTDPDDITMIVFLAKTNLNSGLSLYNKDKEETTSIKYVQNRAVIFDGKNLHKSSLNFGDNIENGRLTLNCFIRF